MQRYKNYGTPPATPKGKFGIRHFFTSAGVFLSKRHNKQIKEKEA